MASSLAAALAALPTSCDAALVVLGDGPGLEREAVERVAARIAPGRAARGGPLREREGAPGGDPPVALAAPAAAGEDGARALQIAPVDVDCTDLGAPGDADTPDELGS